MFWIFLCFRAISRKDMRLNILFLIYICWYQPFQSSLKSGPFLHNSTSHTLEKLWEETLYRRKTYEISRCLTKSLQCPYRWISQYRQNSVGVCSIYLKFLWMHHECRRADILEIFFSEFLSDNRIPIATKLNIFWYFTTFEPRILIKWTNFEI